MLAHECLQMRGNRTLRDAGTQELQHIVERAVADLHGFFQAGNLLGILDLAQRLKRKADKILFRPGRQELPKRLERIKGDGSSLEAQRAAAKLLHRLRRLLPKPRLLLDDLESGFCLRLLHIAEIREQQFALRRDEEKRVVARKAAEVAQIHDLAHEHRLDALLLHESAQTLYALFRAHRLAPFSFALSFIKAISSAPR